MTAPSSVAVMSRSSHTLRSHAPRRSVGFVLALAHLITAVGLPVPTVAGNRHLSPACHGRRCGCSDAARLAGTCCCSRPDSPRLPAGCCSHPTTSKSCGTTEPPSPAPTHEISVRWQLGWEAAQCRGDGPAGLLTSPPSVPPADVVRVAHELQPCGSVPTLTPMLCSIPSRPPTPPPKAD